MQLKEIEMIILDKTAVNRNENGYYVAGIGKAARCIHSRLRQGNCVWTVVLSEGFRIGCNGRLTKQFMSNQKRCHICGKEIECK